MIRTDITKARERAGLSKTELAQDIGITPSNVSRIESGKQAVGVKLAPLLAKRLGLQVIDILYPRPARKRKSPLSA